MIKKGILLLLTIFFYNNIFAQNAMYFEFENRYTLDTKIITRPEVNVYGESKISKSKIGSYYYALTNDKWGEAYGGMYYKPSSWLFINIGAGVEVDSLPYRVNAGISCNYKKMSLSQWYEYGGSGYWYNLQLNYQLKDGIKSGIICKRYYGIGLNLLIDIKKTPITLNLAPFYDFEFKVYKAMALIRFTFM